MNSTHELTATQNQKIPLCIYLVTGQCSNENDKKSISFKNIYMYTAGITVSCDVVLGIDIFAKFAELAPSLINIQLVLYLIKEVV